jgi:hypothetical protein
MDTALLLLIPVLLGAALVLLARWARKSNAKLVAGQAGGQQSSFASAIQQGDGPRAVRLLFFGSVSPAWQRTGTVLAVGVVLLVGGTLGLLAVLLLRA